MSTILLGESLAIVVRPRYGVSPSIGCGRAMAEGIGLRVFLFEADGTLRRLAGRVVDGLIQGEDSMPQYAAQRLRVAYAFLLLDDRTPRTMPKIEGSWWEFDARGRIDDSRIEAVRAALGSIPAKAATSGDAEGLGVTDLRAAIDERRRARRRHWMPTPAEVTRIVHAIWPEQAGRPTTLPEFASGQGKRRYSVSSMAKHAKGKCLTHVWDLSRIVEDLSEHDLKGLISALTESVEEHGDGTEHLWRGVRDLAAWELGRRKARRTKRGTWYAWIRSMTRSRDNDSIWQGLTLEHRACQGRDAAVAASRELLAKYADRFDHDTQIEADVCPAIEWDAQEDQPSGDQVNDDARPRSPLVHPAIVAADFANDE